MEPESKDQQNISSVLKETRSFPPPETFAKESRLSSLTQYQKLWTEAKENPESYWSARAQEELHWFRPWNQTLGGTAPFYKWFDGGLINASYNCLDRHANSWRRNKAAIIWEGEPGDVRTITYGELLHDVQKLANGLKRLGMTAGDRVTVYMPMVPEAVVAMLACARLGLVHCVVFGGFSAEAIADRCNDAQSRLIITADGGYRRGAVVPLKKQVDEALAKAPSVENVIVLRRTNQDIPMHYPRDLWWHDLIRDESPRCEATSVASEHPLFILYTSGSTGKPKGILHSTAGYLLGATLSYKLIFDHRDTDIFWCTADIGWITGHSYVVYGPLSNGATIFMYEGAPQWPDWGRFWRMIEQYRINVLYTAPTAIRSFASQGESWPEKYDLSSLRLLGSVGEPINPEAWMWYHRVIGKERCPIVDTWWQTETGSIMISPAPGAVTTVPGSATLPLPGVVPAIVDKTGKQVKPGEGGFLVITKPWPSMLRTIYGDDDRYVNQYWNQIPGVYFTGDGARQDETGRYWILGRIDDVLNVAGHRLSTMEIESALVSHPKVVEAAVVGVPHAVKGEGIHCFVTLLDKQSMTNSSDIDALAEELSEHVVRQIGALARPQKIRFAEALPKTRSGKLMRRLLRDIAAGKTAAGDLTTLEDLSVLARLREDEETA
jgi:acetyl-CoA synthetase